MSSSQVSAGLGLLKKCLPDLSDVTVSSDGDGLAPSVVIFKTTYEDQERGIPPTPYVPRDYTRRD
jgi:hypothetical protein